MIKESEYVKRAFESGITHADIKVSIKDMPQHIVSHDNALCMYDVYADYVRGCKLEKR